jgi:hypothetical protein
MGLVQTLAPLTLRQLIAGACDAVGLRAGGEAAVAVAGFLAERFTDDSQRLTKALADANDKAWKALEVALAGESFWERCQAAVARAEDRAFGRQVRAFLDAAPLAGLPGHGPEFRQVCLLELRAARKAGLLTGGGLDPRQLARQAGAFARFAEPGRLLDAEWRAVEYMAEELRRAGYPDLGRLVAMRPPEGLPLLVIAARYFFRRAVEDDPKLSQGLAFARMERLGKAQEQGFASLAAALAQRGERLEELLGDVRAVVVETHEAVLDLQAQLRGQGELIRQTGQATRNCPRAWAWPLPSGWTALRHVAGRRSRMVEPRCPDCGGSVPPGGSCPHCLKVTRPELILGLIFLGEAIALHMAACSWTARSYLHDPPLITLRENVVANQHRAETVRVLDAKIKGSGPGSRRAEEELAQLRADLAWEVPRAYGRWGLYPRFVNRTAAVWGGVIGPVMLLGLGVGLLVRARAFTSGGPVPREVIRRLLGQEDKR